MNETNYPLKMEKKNNVIPSFIKLDMVKIC